MATVLADRSAQTGRMVARDVDDEGVRIALSAAQLAAVLEQETLEQDGALGNRLIGGLRLLGCAGEMAVAGALLAAPEPTMLTKAGGVGLALHASDQCATGATQIWTGRDTRSLTERTAARLALTLGASSEVAGQVGMAVEIMVPIGGAALAGAVRAGAIRAGRISLLRHEAAEGSRFGGHTIARHVGRTEAQLRARLAATATARRPPAMVSTFDDLATAERAISRALQVHKQRIFAWAKAAGRDNLVIDLDVGRAVGSGLRRTTGGLERLSKVKVVLRKESYNGMPHFILTSYPI